jgi:hypothetical protein
VRPDDFYIEDNPTFGVPSRHLNIDLLGRLRRGPVPDLDDVEVAVPLARLIHDELERFGTDGGEEMTDQEIREALLALRAVVDRLGVGDFNVPFRDFTSFRSWWIRHGARGNWQARRDLLSDIFEPLHDRVADMEQRSLSSSLADAVSPHARTGWAGVDTEISELRRHFLNARTAQDYRNVGLDCVAVTEALSRQVFDPGRHLREGEEEPPVSKTKQRLERFVEDALPGPESIDLRRLARSAIEFAQHVKHGETPTRRDAGIAADTVILLANLLRRLDQESERSS